MNARGNGSKVLFFLEEMIATPWMTWFSLPSFCASCNWIHFIASLQCHCAEHYSHGAELVTVFPRLSLRRGSGLGSHGGEASGLLEVHWEWLDSIPHLGGARGSALQR
ncbi:hypothetical protein Nmel_013078 [Mimus melanotis]